MFSFGIRIGALLTVLALLGCKPSPNPGQGSVGGGVDVVAPRGQQMLSVSPEPFREETDPLAEQGGRPAREVILPLVDGADTLDPAREMALLKDLRGLERAAAAEEIVAFLETGRDLPTGREFALGGSSRTHASLRTLLLDELGRLDPETAYSVSKSLLKRDQSLPPDPLPAAERDFLRSQWERVAARPEVLDGSCEASLASLGMASFLRDASLLPELFRLRERTPSAAVAASIEHTIERLALRAPTESMAILASDPASFEALPELRGRLLAHADLGQPREMEAVRTFIMNPNSSAEEVESFLLNFPSDSETLRPELFADGQRTLLDGTVKNYAAWSQVISQWQRETISPSAAMPLATMALKLDGLAAQQIPGGSANISTGGQ
jgi:hypothetical protein